MPGSLSPLRLSSASLIRRVPRSTFPSRNCYLPSLRKHRISSELSLGLLRGPLRRPDLPAGPGPFGIGRKRAAGTDHRRSFHGGAHGGVGSPLERFRPGRSLFLPAFVPCRNSPPAGEGLRRAYPTGE